MDHPSVIYLAIGRTFPKIRKWNNAEKNHLFDLIKKFLFDDKILLLEELTQLTNKATSIIISGYQVSVEKNKLRTLEELEKYLSKTQQKHLQELLSKMDNPQQKSGGIEKLKKELPQDCMIVDLKRVLGGTLHVFEKQMSKIFYREKKIS